MVDIWLPNVERVTGRSAGAMNGDGSRKILLHSTEGSTIAGAVGAYRSANSWPTLTVDCRRRRIVQHLPLNVAARALRNDPGGVDQTNRDGTILVQIELVGFAGNPTSIGAPADLDWLGRHVIRPIAERTGVPLVTSVHWAPYPSSYGTRARQRLTGPAWDTYSGVLGHQHCPENSHGDPGAIDITRILAAARGATQEDFDMTPEQFVQHVANGVNRALETEGSPARVGVGDVVEKRLIEILDTPGHPVRTKLRELSRMGSDDAEKNDDPT